MVRRASQFLLVAGFGVLHAFLQAFPVNPDFPANSLTFCRLFPSAYGYTLDLHFYRSIAWEH